MSCFANLSSFALNWRKMLYIYWRWTDSRFRVTEVASLDKWIVASRRCRTHHYDVSSIGNEASSFPWGKQVSGKPWFSRVGCGTWHIQPVRTIYAARLVSSFRMWRTHSTSQPMNTCDDSLHSNILSLCLRSSWWHAVGSFLPNSSRILRMNQSTTEVPFFLYLEKIWNQRTPWQAWSKHPNRRSIMYIISHFTLHISHVIFSVKFTCHISKLTLNELWNKTWN